MQEENRIKLATPSTDGPFSLEHCLQQRRSIRSFADGALSLNEASQLLWAALGLTGSEGQRTAPSAGGLRGLDCYWVSGQVTGIPQGIYSYDPENHSLAIKIQGDLRAKLATACLGQEQVRECAAIVVLSAVYDRLKWKYGERRVRYGDMEAGHAAQNVYLQATSLGLGTVVVGAFEDDAVREILSLSANEHPLYLMPVGRREA
jgi:SagB-type dehydrogenase family enzyme